MRAHVNLAPSPKHRSTHRFIWGFLFAFFSIPTAVVLIIGNALSDESSAVLARLDAAEAGSSGERVITGTVRAPSPEALLQAPASGRRCVAWETSIDMTWTEQDSNGEDEHRTAVVRRGGEATAFDVDDARAGLLATVREPRLELLVDDVVAPLDAWPAWADRLRDEGGQTPRSGAQLWSNERSLESGSVVTVVGTLAQDGAPRMTPGPSQARVTVYFGTPDAWRDEAHSMSKSAWWLHRIAAGLGLVALLMLVGLLRTFVPRRA